jgi:hypothetical protein
MNTALVGVELGRVLGPKAADPEADFYGARLKKAGCAALACCSPVRLGDGSPATAAKDSWPRDAPVAPVAGVCAVGEE